MYKNYSHVISKDLDGGATEADGRASAPVDPSVATPLYAEKCMNSFQIHNINNKYRSSTIFVVKILMLLLDLKKQIK